MTKPVGRRRRGRGVLKTLAGSVVLAALLGGCQTLDSLDNSLSRMMGTQSAGMTSLETRAVTGDAEAAYQMGLAYASGSGVEQNYTTAAQWYAKAAEAGHRDARYLLGLALVSGQGVTRDDTQGAVWLARSAEQGHPAAAYQLGDLYANGRGVTKDLYLAARWYGISASLGHGPGQFAYGVAWAKAIGLPEDVVAAWAWLDRAARQDVDLAARVRDRVGEGLTAAQRQRAQALAGSPLDEPAAADRVAAFSDAPTVRFVQLALARLGEAPGSADGLFGPATAKAVKAFRGRQGLAGEGIIDKALIDALHRELAVQPTA